MTEREKAVAGMLYDAAGDPALLAARDRAKDLCMDYNAMRSAQKPQRLALLRELLAECGDDIVIEAPLHVDYGFNIRVGRAFYANHNLTVLDCAPVTFGDHVFIAPNCVFSAATHPLDAAARNQGLEYARPITVGDNVWFGAGVLVLPGVTIGDNAVIGAGSVVNRDIPANAVAVGNPCRVIRMLE